jgi:hypothetical protein
MLARSIEGCDGSERVVGGLLVFWVDRDILKLESSLTERTHKIVWVPLRCEHSNVLARIYTFLDQRGFEETVCVSFDCALSRHTIIYNVS